MANLVRIGAQFRDFGLILGRINYSWLQSLSYWPPSVRQRTVASISVAWHCIYVAITVAYKYKERRSDEKRGALAKSATL